MKTAMLILALFAVARVGTVGTGRPQTQAPAMVPISDYHQHLFSPAITDGGKTRPSITAKDLVALLDDAGIRKALVLSLAYQYGNPNRPPVENEYE
jgi:hypothetical protein